MFASYKAGLTLCYDNGGCHTYLSLGSYGVDCKRKKKCLFQLNAFYLPTAPETPIMPRPIYINSENAAIGAAVKLLLHLCGGGETDTFSAGDGISKEFNRPRGRPRKDGKPIGYKG